jgi:FkbM family methyltransferase
MDTGFFVRTHPTDDTTDIANCCIYVPGGHKTLLLPLNQIAYYSKSGLYENTLIQWVKQFCSAEKVFLDIGAHTGSYAIELAPYSKQVHAFEPQRLTYYALCGSIALSYATNITAHVVGLGSLEQAGHQILHIPSADGGRSSLHQPPHNCPTEEVEIRTLDSFNLHNIGFIKIDVEDNELSVLQGATETLKRSNYPPILFEANRSNPPLFNYISELGYQISPINYYSNMFLASMNTT